MEKWYELEEMEKQGVNWLNNDREEKKKENNNNDQEEQILSWGKREKTTIDSLEDKKAKEGLLDTEFFSLAGKRRR